MGHRNSHFPGSGYAIICPVQKQFVSFFIAVRHSSTMNKLNRNIFAMANHDSDSDHDGSELLAPEKVKLKPPSLYRVVLLNDDYTPMEFVVEILQKFFGMNMEGATRVMLKVHTEGKGVCGVFPKDIAESKSLLVNDYARENQHPLLSDIEAEE